MDHRPDIGELVFVLADTGIFYGVVLERREIEKPSGLTEAFLVEYYDSIAPCKYATAVFGRDQLEGGRHPYGVAGEWLRRHGKDAKEFAERRAAEVAAEMESAKAA